jgi:UDP-N-acetyl-2-amino-2-deoxyglucuronate dehydrogenase
MTTAADADSGQLGIQAVKGKTGIGIIGLGMAVQPHAQALQELSGSATVIAGFSPTPARRAAFEKTFGLPTVATEAALLADPAVDVVLVLTPPRTHAEVALRAARAGKHVLVEKPLDVDLASARALVDAFDDAGRTLGVVLQHRFRRSPMALKQLLGERALGDLLSVSASVRWWRSAQYYAEPGRGMRARDGGGVLLTQAIHTLDLLLYLVGPAASVTARCSNSGLRSMDTEDIGCAVVDYAGGAVGVIDTTTLAYPGYPERIDIAGSAGTAVLEGDRLIVQRPGLPTLEMAGTSGGGGGADPMAFSPEAHRRLLEEFLAALAEGREPINSGRSALAVHGLLDAMLESSARGLPVPVRGN